MAVEAYASLSAAGQQHWGNWSPGAPFTSFQWAEFGEQVYRGEQHYLHVIQEGNRVAAAVSSVRRNEPLPINQPLLRKLLGLWIMKRPLLTCQIPVASVSGLMLDRAGTSRQPFHQALTTALIERLIEQKGSFLLFPYLSEQMAMQEGWGQEFFTVTLPPGTFLPIRWANFDQYLAGLKPSARKDYRLHLNRAARLGLSTHIRPEPPEKKLALRLIRNVEIKHSTAPNPYAGSLMDEAASVDGKWLVVEQEDRMVGCGLILEDNNDIMLTLLGLENGVQQVYFSLMYGAIRYAIENGLSGLHGGGGAYYFKSRLGYTLMKNNYIKVYAANRVLSHLGRYLASRAATMPAASWPVDARAFGGFLLGW